MAEMNAKDDVEIDAREDLVAELRVALEEMECGEGLPERFVGGHGLMSRTFEFKWSDPRLEIDFRLPDVRVLAGDESQKDDDAEIGASIRLAILLLTVEGQKDNGLEGLKVRVWAGDGGVGYSLLDEDGNAVDSGDDWSGLVRRLESALPDGDGGVTVIWP